MECYITHLSVWRAAIYCGTLWVPLLLSRPFSLSFLDGFTQFSFVACLVGILPHEAKLRTDNPTNKKEKSLYEKLWDHLGKRKKLDLRSTKQKKFKHRSEAHRDFWNFNTGSIWFRYTDQHKLTTTQQQQQQQQQNQQLPNQINTQNTPML